MKHIALIPAYEPDETLLKLLSELKAADYETVVVDDGSGAKYSEIFVRASADALVLTHDTNMGKGAALKTGLLYIEENCPADCVVVTLDADGQHKIPDAERVCADAENHIGALCLGSRAFTGKVPLRSRFGNTLTRWAFTLSTGKRCATPRRACGPSARP